MTLFTPSEAVAFAMAGMAFGVLSGFLVGAIFGRASKVAEAQGMLCDSCCAEIGMTNDRVNALCAHLGVPDDDEGEE